MEKLAPDLSHVKLCFDRQVNVRAVSSGLGEASMVHGRFKLSHGNEKFLEPRFI